MVDGRPCKRLFVMIRSGDILRALKETCYVDSVRLGMIFFDSEIGVDIEIELV